MQDHFSRGEAACARFSSTNREGEPWFLDPSPRTAKAMGLDQVTQEAPCSPTLYEKKWGGELLGRQQGGYAPL